MDDLTTRARRSPMEHERDAGDVSLLDMIARLTAERDALRAQINAADELVRTVESLTGNIWSTPIPNALAAYRNARKPTP